MLMFLYVFIWPFVLGLLSILGVFFSKRHHLRKTATALALLILTTPAPLAYIIGNSHDRGVEDLAISSLGLYPATLALFLTALLGRLASIYLKRRAARDL